MSTKPFPLAHNQLDIWYDQAAYPENPLYNIGGTLSLHGSIHYAALNQSIKQLVKENTALNLSITPLKGEIYQTHTDTTVQDLEFHNFSLQANAENASHTWLEKTFKEPFSLKHDESLWHFALIKVSTEKYYLMTKFHHLIADGWTTKIVISRLAELYNANLKNKIPKPHIAPDYLAFVQQEQNYLNSKQFIKDELFWQKNLAKLPTPLILPRYPIKNKQTLPQANIHRFHLNRSFYNQLNQFSKAHNSTIYHLLICTLSLYFSRITQSDHIVIGTPSLNRSGAKFKETLGMFISLSPLSLNIDTEKSAHYLLKLCGTHLRETYRHQRYPLNLTSKRLKLIQQGRNTLFDLVVSYEKQDYSTPYGETKISAQQQFSGIARYPLAVTICEFHQHDDVEIILEGSETAFTTQDLVLLSQRIHFLLEQIMAHPEMPLKQIDLIPASEKQFIHSVFNQTFNNLDAPDPVIQQFEAQVTLHGTAIALEDNNQKLSYEQLNNQSNQLAHQLIKLGAKKHLSIAICMPRCMEMIIAILAILKTGAAYLPIDPDTPSKRITEILKQSHCTLLLSINSLILPLKPFSKILHWVTINEISATIANPNIQIEAQSLAYIIFTSGSTGKPKGVMLPHLALSHRLTWIQENFNIIPTDRIAQTIQFCFDPSLIEIFGALTQGATLVLAPKNYQTPNEFASFIIEKKINAIALVPSSLRNLLQGLKTEQTTALKVACCGGEVLTPELAEQFQQQTNASLFNVYGPTEATLFATAWLYTKTEENTLPIGKPISNSSIYIFDQYNQTLPIGVTGEIVIGSNALALGYLHDSQLTQEKFIADPFASAAANRYLYKTGDLGYIGTDGQLYFQGRIDRQVKISAYRIELGEIEAVLNSHKQVKIAAVQVINQKIYAYIETIPTYSDELEANLLRCLNTQLPVYMQVSAIIPITNMPINSTGKVSYSALPLPTIKKKQTNPRRVSTPLEIQLTQLWHEVLKNNRITPNDNFFELGGDSLAAIGLIQKIEQLTGYSHSLSLLLEHPTIRLQATFLDSELPKQYQPIFRTLSENTAIKSPSLYLAASGKGDSLRFKNLAKKLENICTLHILTPAEYLTNPSITDLATEYVKHIIARNEDPGYIGGFSIGGITALETANLLTQQGKPPLGVLLLDTTYPRWPLKSPRLFKLTNDLVKLLHLNKLTVNGRRLNMMLSDHGISIQLNAIQNHSIKPFKGPIGLLSSTHIYPKRWFFAKWDTLFGKQLQHFTVLGFHGSMFQEKNVDSLSLAIRQFMKIG